MATAACGIVKAVESTQFNQARYQVGWQRPYSMPNLLQQGIHGRADTGFAYAHPVRELK